MSKIIKLRWILLVIWVAAALVLTVIQPDLKKVIDEKGNPTVTEKYPSKIAEKLLNGMSDSKGEGTLIVFNNEKKLTSNDRNEIQTGLEILEQSKKELGITNILSSFNTPQAKGQLESEDGTTILTSVTIERNGRDVQEISKQFEDKLKDIKVDHYLTGGLFVQKDFLTATYKGVDRSAIITVLFILIVLFLVFKSITTPLISLLTVGIAYLCSMGIVGQLVNAVNFSVTSLTQMFMILVLFGIGTDYNILLFNRFKEELGRNESINSAIVATYRTAGKTILYSGLTVFIAFASLSFVQFGVYRSGNAVAIGIVVLFLELVTLTPFFMKLLGPKLFWPSHETKGHRESKLWEKVTSATVKHPIVSTLALIAVIAPIIIFSSSNLSYDNMKDMGSSYPSVKGFNIVSKHFNRGTTMPTTVVIKNSAPMDNNTALSVIDKLTEDLKGVKGVKAVSGPTQPEGSKIKDLYTDSSLKKISDSLGQLSSGLSNLGAGMPSLQSNPGDTSDGMSAISGQLSQATNYLSDLAETKSFFIPKAALQSGDFKKSLDAFMSADMKTVKLIVILNDDPYSSEAIKTVKRINDTVESNLKGSALSKADFGTGGESSVSNDTNIISTRDMTVTQIIVFLSVFILLILVIRSFWIPVYIIIALAASYYTAISITGFITSNLFRADGIAWNVPFFSFIMIVALGVDYSIFLMTRYKEYKGIPPQKAIVSAAKNIGGVVVSAAIILAGTFATLLPSGLHTLMEMAVSVGVGLLMLSLLMLPVFIPAMISLPQTISKIFMGKSNKTIAK